MKPYQKIPIEECGEPLVAIPLEHFAVELPHPYEKLGAVYGKRSPYYLRQGVVDALLKAQFFLNKRNPGWHLKIFDAYRPVGVQQFMVDYTFDLIVQKKGLQKEKILPQQKQDIWEEVYQLWAAPSLDLKMPPPHSTGSAVDLTLVNDKEETLDMGGAIDELSPRSIPNYYAASPLLKEQQFHRRRELLNQVMSYGEFQRHPKEWWHFSLGDQMWVWLNQQKDVDSQLIARYGRV
ncbi:MAG: M15 family metallopeptidase [Xenococcaceae cyanobacterium MO_188.B29]|nr:M15 family metallopeptidase [Xenococcaceae cyanobacterium MO_188.B29]